MSAFVALLRGVNVGGHNRIAMADLREIVGSLGHGAVATYIQSGNVVFAAGAASGPAEAGTGPADEDRLAEAVRVAIAARLGLEVAVMVRSRASLAAVLAAVPFPDRDPKRLLVDFLAAAPSPDARRSLEAAEAAPEAVRVVGREAYLDLPDGVGRSVLAPLVERRLRVAATGRNLATVRTLLAMLEAIES